MGSVFCGNLKISVFGESHGEAIGMVLDGFPPGMKIDTEFLLGEIARRRPKQADYSTKRKESDMPQILSGVLNGVTEGSPICMVIKNTDMKKSDYNTDVFRPSHADYTGFLRYKGFNDASGGGHFSGRLTAPYVLAGALCRQYLKQKFGVNIYSHIKNIGGVYDKPFDTVSGVCAYDEILSGSLPVSDKNAEALMLNLINKTAKNRDSVGGSIECMVTGVKAGLGSPAAGGVESRLAPLLFAVPAVKGVEFGVGFGFAELTGSGANDVMEGRDGKIYTKTNNNGGILGGITNGMPLCFTVCIKPTPSIGQPQGTVNKYGENTLITVNGRHDPCIVPRAVPVIESVAAIALLDIYLEAYGYGNT